MLFFLLLFQNKIDDYEHFFGSFKTMERRKMKNKTVLLQTTNECEISFIKISIKQILNNQ